MRWLKTLALVSFAGCATMGHDFDSSRVRELKPGVATLADATKLLGAPFTTSMTGDGRTMAMWMYSDGSAVPLPFYTQMNHSSKSVTLWFGADGKLQASPYAAAPQQGPDFNPSLVSVLKPGVSTLTDAKALFGGEPNVTNVINEREMVCVWSRGEMAPGDGSAAARFKLKLVSLVFAMDGTYLRVTSDPAAPPPQK